MDPKVAVVGCGHWGRHLVRNMAELGALTAVCDVDDGAAQQAADAFGVRGCTWRELLDTRTVDGIVVATPPATHGQLAIEAMEAGKDVMVEKPLALELAEAEAVCRASKRTGRVLMVGHLLQYHPAFVRMREIVTSGDIGALRYIYSNRLNFGQIRRQENILWSFAPHDISMIVSLCGHEPDTVQCVGAYYINDRIADVTTTHLRFPGGERAHIFVSWLHPSKEQKLVVVGETGMLTFDDCQPWERKLTLHAHKVDMRSGAPVAARAEPELLGLTPDEPLRAECSQFLARIRDRQQPLTDGEEGLRVMRVLTRAQASLQKAGRTAQ